MKTLITRNVSVVRLSVLTGFAVGCILLSNPSFGQTYYSKFSSPTSAQYATINPTGESCTATPIQNVTGFVDNDDNTFSYFTANTATSFTCDGNYKFDTYLNLPPDSTSLGAGYRAGFNIKVPSGISKDSLGKYLIIGSYLNGQFQEYNTGSNLLGLDAGQDGVNWFVYFTTTKPFNILELSVDPKIVPVNTNFEFDVIYAKAEYISVLPAQIANFKAAVAGKNISLSWQSLTETNVATYRIEKSSNGGASYSPVTSLPARGNSNAAVTYGYTDQISVNGNYLYRIVTVNKDGTTKTTNSIIAVISGQGNLFLYPSIVKAGQNIIVKTSEIGLVTVHFYDEEGRMVSQQRINSTGQFSLSTSGLSSGVYTIKVVASKGNVLQSKVVVN